MAGGMSIVSLLFALLSGGANDLLDFVSTDAYWKAKGVTVSVEQLIEDSKTPQGVDVAAQIKLLGSTNYAEREGASKKIMSVGPAALASLEKAVDDPDAEVANRVRGLMQQIRLNTKATGVRRLMAIRSLGEMKKADALPALKAALESKEMFVADYAARAIAEIEGKPVPKRAVSRDAIKGDLSLLPANCAIIGQSVFATDKAISFDKLIATVPPQPGEDRKAMVEQLANEVIKIADQIGNVRLEAITFGVSDTVGPNDGFAATILRGKYDARAVAEFVRKQLPNSQNVDGLEVFGDDAAAVGFLSDERALAVSGASREKLPIKEILAASRANPTEPHKLLKMPEFAPFIASLNDKTVGWGICKVSDSFRQAPIIQPFDTITFQTTKTDGGVSVKFDAAGKDDVAIKSAVSQMNTGLNEARQALPQLAQMMPAMKPVNEFVQGLKCEADGKKATLTGAFNGDPATLMAVPFMMMGVRAEAAPPVPQQAQPAQVQPAQPEKKEEPKKE